MKLCFSFSPQHSYSGFSITGILAWGTLLMSRPASGEETRIAVVWWWSFVNVHKISMTYRFLWSNTTLLREFMFKDIAWRAWKTEYGVTILGIQAKLCSLIVIFFFFDVLVCISLEHEALRRFMTSFCILYFPAIILYMLQQLSYIFVFQPHPAQCRNCTRVVDMTERVPTFVKISVL